MLDLEVSERAAEIVGSLWQHCEELGVLREELKKPNLPTDQKGQLDFRVSVLRKKINQICGRLQVA
ncbi:hypothetical protein KKF25_03420 [Patescibacteria group bacterium]|nr:hypothetical protein [Patescibacteria group bacterium]